MGPSVSSVDTELCESLTGLVIPRRPSVSLFFPPRRSIPLIVCPWDGLTWLLLVLLGNELDVDVEAVASGLVTSKLIGVANGDVCLDPFLLEVFRRGKTVGVEGPECDGVMDPE